MDHTPPPTRNLPQDGADLPVFVSDVLALLKSRQLRLGVAESDTGGLLLAWLTSLSGSSEAILGGVVAYHDRLKRELLGVPAALLAEHGAVSAAVVEAMAHGVRVATGAELGLASTGIAGPAGATPTKPVGLAFLAATDGTRTLVRECHWSGDRAANRRSSAEAALQLLVELLDAGPPEQSEFEPAVERTQDSAASRRNEQLGSTLGTPPAPPKSS